MKYIATLLILDSAFAIALNGASSVAVMPILAETESNSEA